MREVEELSFAPNESAVGPIIVERPHRLARQRDQRGALGILNNEKSQLPQCHELEEPSCEGNQRKDWASVT